MYPGERSRPLTAEEFQALPDEPGYRLELVRGMVVRSPGPGARHGEVEANVVALLHPWIRRHRLGRLLSGGGSYILQRNPDTVRGPDVSFLPRGSVPPGALRDSYLDGAPALAIEILSPSNRAGEIRARLTEFFHSGCREAWLIDPRRRVIEVHRAEGRTLGLGAGDTLQTPLLPGWRCGVAEIFAAG
jgi:Uma2 family endonuclease